MAKRKRAAKCPPRLNLEMFKTYAELKAFALAHSGEFTAQQNWAIVERMRQLRYGYKPGELRMDRKNLRCEILSVEEFRSRKELEDAEDLRLHGPL